MRSEVPYVLGAGSGLLHENVGAMFSLALRRALVKLIGALRFIFSSCMVDSIFVG